MANLVKKTTLDNSDLDLSSVVDPIYRTNDWVFINNEKEASSHSLFDRQALPSGYALMNGAQQANKLVDRCRYWLRSFSYTGNIDIVDWDCLLNCIAPNESSPCIRPAMHLDPDALAKAIKEGKVELKLDSLGFYTRLTFGSYPQSHAENSEELERLFMQGLMTKTGKTYAGYMWSEKGMILNNEYEYKGKKYVRVFCKAAEYERHYPNGEEVPKSGGFDWAVVKPIVWEIRNWDNLPRTINPDGNGQDDFVDIISNKGLVGGMPFAFGTHPNHMLWQNSPIRAYLNGYDLHAEIELGNGIKKYRMENNFDFSGRGFIDEANLNLDAPALTNGGIKDKGEKMEKRKTRLERLNPDKTSKGTRRNITDTELIKSWIDSGESVLLRGPSGIGKTERLKKLYPNLIYIKLTNNMFPEKVVGSMNLQTGQEIPPSFAKEALLQCSTSEEKKLIKENIQNLYDLADTIYERSKTSEGKVVILLDELLNVKPAIQSLVYTLVLNKLVETGKGLKLPANTVVVATGNQKKYSSVAEDLAEPLEKRFDHILDMEPKVGEWIYEYALPEGLHPTVIGYIFSKYMQSRRSEKISEMGYFYEEPEVGESHLDKNGGRGKTNDPRGWVSLSTSLKNFEENLKNGVYEGKNVEDVLMKALSSKLREEWAKEFFDFYNNPTITIEEILDNSYSQADLPKNTNEKFATMAGLLTVNEDQVAAARTFIRKQCDPEYLAIFDMYWAGNDEKRMEKIAELRASDLSDAAEEEEKKPKEKRITLDEFWDKDKKYAIMVKSSKESADLCKAFDRMGKTWNNGDKYIEDTLRVFLNDQPGTLGSTAYYLNSGEYVYSPSYLEDNGYEIFDFDDVDLGTSGKLTLERFWASKQKLAIHVKNLQEANTLCRAFDKFGKKWKGGQRYANNTFFSSYNTKTAYTNSKEYGSVDYVKNNMGSTIIEFDDVDLGKWSKTTLDEFFASDETLGIHVRTQEEATALCRAFTKFGKMQRSDLFKHNTSSTVYTNKGTFYSLDYFNYTTRGSTGVYEFDDVELGKYDGKLTLDEFFASTEDLAIRVTSKEEAEKLCSAFDKMGRKWASGKSYTDTNFKEGDKELSYTKDSCSRDSTWLRGMKYEIIDFKDVDLGKYGSKLTLDEFWKYKGDLAIRVTSEEEARILCNAFDKMGKKWGDGHSYALKTHFDKHDKEMMFLNDGFYSKDSDWLIGIMNYRIVDFKDVDLGGYDKITLDEFWSGDKKCIHVNSIDEASALFRAFDKMGKKWADGTSYVPIPLYKKDEAYDNRNTCNSFEYYKHSGDYQIYEFEDIDLGEYASDKRITLYDFFADDNCKAIRVNTQEEENRLCRAFNKMGKRRITGSRYFGTDYVADYGNPVAFTNEGEWASALERLTCPIYDFKDVDLGKYDTGKITLKKFCGKKNIAIRTHTKEELHVLIKMFDEMGIKTDVSSGALGRQIFSGDGTCLTIAECELRNLPLYDFNECDELKEMLKKEHEEELYV